VSDFERAAAAARRCCAATSSTIRAAGRGTRPTCARRTSAWWRGSGAPRGKIRDTRSCCTSQDNFEADEHRLFDFENHFSCVAAALLESLPLPDGLRTGVQEDGWIPYRKD